MLLREVIKHPFLFDIKSPILLAERQRESETATQMERLNASSWGVVSHDGYRHICTSVVKSTDFGAKSVLKFYKCDYTSISP